MGIAGITERGCKQILGCLLASLFIVTMAVTSSYAQGWSKEYTVTLPIEGVSDKKAYVNAINKIRVMAAEDAGRYVQGDEVIANDKYAKSIHVASAAIVSVKNISERTFKSGALRKMQVTGTAYVDNGVLQQQIAAIRKNAQLARNLQHENDALAGIFFKLSRIDKQMESVKGVADYLALQAQRTSEEAAFREVLASSRAELGLKDLNSLYVKSKLQNIKSQRWVEKTKQEILKSEVMAESYDVRVIKWLKKNYYQRIALGTSIKLHIDGVSAGKIMAIRVQWDTHMGCRQRSPMMKKMGFYFSNYTVKNPDVLKARYDPGAVNYDLRDGERFRAFLGGCVSWPSTWDMPSNIVYKFYHHNYVKEPKPEFDTTGIGILASMAYDDQNPYTDKTLEYHQNLPVLKYIKTHFLKIAVNFKVTGEPIDTFFIFDGSKLKERGVKVVYARLPENISDVQGVEAHVEKVM